MTFKEAMQIAKTIGISHESEYDGMVVLHLTDGSELRFTSEYDEDISDVTPGNGLQPPTVTYKTVIDVQNEIAMAAEEERLDAALRGSMNVSRIPDNWVEIRHEFYQKKNGRHMTDEESVFLYTLYSE